MIKNDFVGYKVFEYFLENFSKLVIVCDFFDIFLGDNFILFYNCDKWGVYNDIVLEMN